MIHYHGGVPHTDGMEWWEFFGRNFCVSYAYPAKVELFHEIGQSVMLDNGAFSLWKDGKPVDWPAYYRWCERWLEWQTTWAIIPDVIDGDWRDNDRLIAEWPFGTKGAPVYHITGPLERLARLCEEWPLVCLGISSVEYGTIGSPPWRRRMEQVMDVATYPDDDPKGRAGMPRTRLHLLRGLAFSAGPYPLFSADSASVAMSAFGMPAAGQPPKKVHEFYARFDGRNPPARWVRPAQQDALFEVAGPVVEDPDLAGPLGAEHARVAVPARTVELSARNGARLGRTCPVHHLAVHEGEECEACRRKVVGA
jgi:hypothetical protein